MYTEKDFQAVRDIIIKDVPGTAGIILFGSYARGEAKNESDMDIMILIEKDFTWRERRDVLNRLYRDTAHKGYLVDFLLKLEEKYKRDKFLPTISGTVTREGKPLWMKD